MIELSKMVNAPEVNHQFTFS